MACRKGVPLRGARGRILQGNARGPVASPEFGAPGLLRMHGYPSGVNVVPCNGGYPSGVVPCDGGYPSGVVPFGRRIVPTRSA